MDKTQKVTMFHRLFYPSMILIVFLSAPIQTGCTRHEKGAENYMELTIEDSPRNSGARSWETVSLNKMKQIVLSHHKKGKGTEDLLFGGLTNITGYRWTETDLEIFGEIGGDTSPYPLDMIVESLRLARYRMMLASLEPLDKGRQHAILAIPAELYDTWMLDRMIAHDYATKAHVLARGLSPLPGIESVIERVRKEIMSCSKRSHLGSSANMYFISDGLPSFSEENLEGQFKVEMGELRIKLVTGKDVEDQHMINFSKEYTEKIDDLYRRFISLRDLVNVYRLFWIAQSIRKDERSDETGGRAEILEYWLKKYTKKPHDVKKVLPGVGHINFGRFCFVNHKEEVYSIEVNGGVIVGYGDETFEEPNFEINFMNQQMNFIRQQEFRIQLNDTIKFYSNMERFR